MLKEQLQRRLLFTNALIVCVLCAFFGQVSAQTSVQGRAVAQDQGLGIEGVQVFAIGAMIGRTFTDSLGYFTIQMESNLAQASTEIVLRFAHPAFLTHDTLVQFGRYILVSLQEKNTVLQVVQVQQLRSRLIPVPHAMITKAALQIDDGLQIAPALNRVAGVYMHTGTLNTNRIVIRGIGSRSAFGTSKIKAYLDDIPLTSGDGETTLEDIDPTIIEEIRVYKGPTASMYGAGLGGLIHLRTQLSSPSDSSKTQLEQLVSAGSFGLLRSVTKAQFANNRGKLAFNYHVNKTDGYRENNRTDRSGLTILGSWRVNRRQQLTLLAQNIDLKAFIPSSLNRADYENNPQKADTGWRNVQGNEAQKKYQCALGHRIRIADIGKYRLSNVSSVALRTRKGDEVRPFNVLDESVRSLNIRNQIELRYQTDQSMPFALATIGVELLDEIYDWATYQTLAGGVKGALRSDNEELRRNLNFFAQSYVSPLKSFRVLLGANLNATRYHYKDVFFSDTIDLSGNYQFDPVFSPHIGVTWQAKPQFQVFGTVSHGFSPPTVAETLTPSGAINPDIKPETGVNTEIGLRMNLFKVLQLETSVYDMQVRNLLVAERIGLDQYVGVNAGKTRHKGLDLDLRSQRSRGLNGFLTYTFTHYRFVEFINRDQDNSGNPLTGVAPHHVQCGLDYRHRVGVFGGINYQYLSAYPIKDDNSAESEPFSVVNMHLGFSRKLSQHLNFDLRGGLQNLMDTKYASMILINASSFGNAGPRYYYPGLPRNWFSSLSLRYQF
jgi:iron complex outermembrane recepter protein